MADKKITQLTNITGANLVDADEFVVVDISADETKAITLAELKTAFDSGSGFVRITGDTMTGNLTVPTVDINGGTIDGTVIGGTTPAAGDFTSLTGDGLDLNAIAATKAGTAVDVYVYDTSLDSDGGAWRHRTQATSWYNETLNTATRGSRKEFPAVAVIVAEAAKVTIYDGDDPDLPMWKSIGVSGDGEYTAQTAILGSSGDVTSVSALNGLLSIGSNTGGTTTTSMNGLTRINLVGDYVYGTNATYTYKWLGSLGDTATQAYWTNLGTGTAIVNLNINDVAMTVLPNAPIDAATGLPVPTIAIASNGGVSVIKDDGTVVDITSSSDYDRSLAVRFTSENRLAFGQHSNSTGLVAWVHTIDIPSVDRVVTVNTKVAGEGYYDTRNPLAFNQDFWVNQNANVSGDAVEHISAMSNMEFAVTTGILGITKIAEQGSRINPLGAYITSSYNTGWMNGDIKLATLSDTDTTSVTGAELVTNGTFDSNTTGWTASSGTTLSVSSSALSVVSGSSDGYAYQAISTVVGETYTLSFDYKKVSGSIGIVRIGTSAGGQENWYSGSTQMTSTTFAPYTNTFVATATTTYLSFWSRATGGEIHYDNISVRLAEEDRSVNGNGLQVFGTITKTVVETGADLVGYSGFSASNYLQQPYNADLDFGTGDFSVMGWLKLAALGSSRAYLYRAGNGSSNDLRIGKAATTHYPFIDIAGTSLSGSTALGLNAWTSLCFVRKSGVAYIYVNGVLDVEGSSTGDVNGGTTFSPTVIGSGFNYAAADTFFALWRISATAPTAAQIAKMYEDEKFLFQENAQATLYGSSDAVTALAYDDTTDLLHVGTSQGRSVFQGLRRVDNTTDAITAAISASNNLVAEE